MKQAANKACIISQMTEPFPMESRFLNRHRNLHFQNKLKKINVYEYGICNFICKQQQ
jgi:hypothetical protein